MTAPTLHKRIGRVRGGGLKAPTAPPPTIDPWQAIRAAISRHLMGLPRLRELAADAAELQTFGRVLSKAEREAIAKRMLPSFRDGAAHDYREA